MFLDEKSSQECPVNVGVSQGSILGPTLFLLCFNDLPDNDICNIAIYADNAILYFKFDLRDTVDWSRKWLVDFNAGKTQLVSFVGSNNTGAIDVKMDGSVLQEK